MLKAPGVDGSDTFYVAGELPAWLEYSWLAWSSSVTMAEFGYSQHELYMWLLGRGKGLYVTDWA